MPHTSKILMLYTGGTIGMVPDEKKRSLVPFDFQSLLDKIPDIRQLDCEIDTDSLDHPIDSSDMKPEHWLRLARRIADGYETYDGFVILHGSDTMAYTASGLSFILENLGKPVILTGSQLPIGVPRSDARENLLTTLEIAMAKKHDGTAMVPEVGIYFEYDLFRGNRCHKISTEDFEAFRSMNYPKLAEAGVNIKYHQNYIAGTPADQFSISEKLETEIGVLTVFPGMTPNYVRPVLENPHLKGLILRSFGSGNAPTDPWFLDMLRDSIERGVWVVNNSQCAGGGIALGKYEASREMKDMGVISSGDMSFESSLAKMMFLLPQTSSYEGFKQLYETSLRGELTDR